MCSRCFQFLSSLDTEQMAKLSWFCEDDESNEEDTEAVSGAAQGDGVAANLPRQSDASAAGDQTPPLHQGPAEKLDAVFGQPAADLPRSMSDTPPTMPSRRRSASGPRQGG